MGILDCFRRGRKKKVDEEKESLERTGKLQTEIEKDVEKEPKKRKKESD